MKRVGILAGMWAGVLLLGVTAWGSEIPDWARIMVGRWTGTGQREYLASGLRLELRSEVSASWKQEEAQAGLVSTNRIKEMTLRPDGSTAGVREYELTYWVQETAREGNVARLQFGSGDVPGMRPGARGSYDSITMRMSSRQDLSVGASAGLRVEVDSDFASQEFIESQERVSIGGRPYTSASIRFQKSTF